jgi:hypothetical protein
MSVNQPIEVKPILVTDRYCDIPHILPTSCICSVVGYKWVIS